MKVNPWFTVVTMENLYNIRVLRRSFGLNHLSRHCTSILFTTLLISTKCISWIVYHPQVVYHMMYMCHIYYASTVILIVNS